MFFAECTDSSCHFSFARANIICRPGVQRANGDNNRFKRADLTAGDTLKVHHDGRGTDSRIHTHVRHRTVAADTVDMDPERVCTWEKSSLFVVYDADFFPCAAEHMLAEAGTHALHAALVNNDL